MTEPSTEQQTETTPPTPPDAGTSEVEQLRARVAELEAQQETTTATTEPPAPAEADVTLEPSGASYKRDAASQVFEGLTVEMRRYDTDGLWLFGVVVNGVFLPISQAKAGYIDTELQEAADPGHKQQLLDNYRREQLGLG